MSSMMDNSMIAQNTTLQLAVVGRNTFIGANTVFTDFHLESGDEESLTREQLRSRRIIKTLHRGQLAEVGMPVLGSAIGHNCKIGSGFVIYPGRMIGSHTTLALNTPQINLIRKNINVAERDPRYNISGYNDMDDDGTGTGSTRQTVYYWPDIHNASRPSEETAEHDDRHTGSNGKSYHAAHEAEQHANQKQRGASVESAESPPITIGEDHQPASIADTSQIAQSLPHAHMLHDVGG
jgi:hypothetical protein